MTDWRSEKRKRTKLVAIRMTPDERARVDAAAATMGISVGRFIREAALGRAVRLNKRIIDEIVSSYEPT